jgi:TetR/AcrR family transcriptional regulator, regulator of cefoperazone and chloramphenicol sensitivity
VSKFCRKGVKSEPASPVDGEAVVAALDAAATRHRLLDAAGAVFAEVGYERAGVREICARARANVAAVKYHFGGKYQLYEAAISHWFERQERQRPIGQPNGSSNGRDSLRAFVDMFVGRLLDSNKPAWHARLMAREMVEPTGVLDKMVAQSMLPMVQHLRQIVLGIVGPGCPNVVVERAMLSVVSQCVFYLHCRPVLERIFPAHAKSPDLDAIAAHIAQFSTAGLQAICRANSKKKRATA